MGETPAETLSEIERKRAELQRDLDLLERRLPAPDDLADQAKVAGAAVGGGVLLLGLLYAFGKHRVHERRRYRDARKQASALAEILEDGPHTLRIEGGDPPRSVTGPLALVAALAALAVGVVQFLQDRQRPSGGPANP